MTTQRRVENQGHESLLEEVLGYYRQFGWSMFPLNGKHPVGGWKKFQYRAAGEAELRRMFAFRNVTGFGVLGGYISCGLVVRDWDDAEAYWRWAEQYRDIAALLPTAQTRRGFHNYFIGPSGYCALDDGEYRGDNGHFSVLPPSIHPDTGLPYGWIRSPSYPLPTILDPTSVGLLPVGISPSEGGKSRGSKVTVTNNISLTTPPNSPNPIKGGKGKKQLPSPIAGKNGLLRGWLPPTKVLHLARIHCPTVAGERNRRIMDYVRALQRTEVKWDTFRAKMAFMEWWQYASSVVETKCLANSLRDFYGAWTNCPDQEKRLDVGRLLGTFGGLSDNPLLDNCGDNVKRLAAACVCLQGINGGKAFFLAAEDAGRILGVGAESGRLALRRLVTVGFLERISVGSNLTSRASVYCCDEKIRGKLS